MAHVLLLDRQSAETRRLLTLLIELGHRVTISEDGRAGPKLAREGRADLVLASTRLPELDGLALARHMAEERVKAPLILFGREDDQTMRPAAHQAGAADFIREPVTLENLSGSIRRIADTEMRRREAAGPAVPGPGKRPPQAVAPDAVVIDLATGAETNSPHALTAAPGRAALPEAPDGLPPSSALEIEGDLEPDEASENAPGGVPTLPESPDEVPTLFLERVRRHAATWRETNQLELSPALESFLRGYAWPANGRELDACARWAAAFTDQSRLTLAHLSPLWRMRARLADCHEPA